MIMNCPIFLVRGAVTKTLYMADESTTEELTRLVMAATIGHAERKFVEHFERMSDSYGVSYSARVIESSAAIS